MHWIGLKTLVARECGVIVRFWGVTIAPPILATVLYFTIFGEIFGHRIGSVEGVTYTRYMAPGLILLWAIPYSFGHTASAFVGARTYRYIEELRVSTMPAWLIAAGYVAGGTIRGPVVAISVGLTSCFYTSLALHSFPMSIGALVLSCLMSAVCGFIAATFARTFDQITMIQALILTPLAYIGGAFVPLSELPGWARESSLANPIFYSMNAFRYGVLGVSDVRLDFALAALPAFAAFLVLVALARTNSMSAWVSEHGN